MRDAIEAIITGDWVLVFDPSKLVIVATDAASEHGYCITAHQEDAEGRIRPILFYSAGWVGPQAHWGAQIKECYAQMRAVAYFMPTVFPHARVRLLPQVKGSPRSRSPPPLLLQSAPPQPHRGRPTCSVVPRRARAARGTREFPLSYVR
jgi:hypothetical protein